METLGVYELLERCYDDIWIVGWKPLFDPTSLYEFPGAVSAKARFCGYIVRQASHEATAAIRQEFLLGDEPLALVSAGGGGDGYALLRAYADALEVRSPAVAKSVVCLGPDMPPQHRNDLKQRLLPRRGVLLFDFRPDLVSFLPLAHRSPRRWVRWRKADLRGRVNANLTLRFEQRGLAGAPAVLVLLAETPRLRPSMPRRSAPSRRRSRSPCRPASTSSTRSFIA